MTSTALDPTTALHFATCELDLATTTATNLHLAPSERQLISRLNMVRQSIEAIRSLTRLAATEASLTIRANQILTEALDLELAIDQAIVNVPTPTARATRVTASAPLASTSTGAASLVARLWDAVRPSAAARAARQALIAEDGLASLGLGEPGHL